MFSKILVVVALFCSLEAVNGDCSWTDEEKSMNCCDLPSVRADYAKVCAEELNYSYPPVKTDHFDNCAEECIYKKTGFLGADNKLDGDKIMERGMKIDKTEWVNTVHHGIEHCNSKTFDSGTEKCSAAPAKYTHCLVHYMYLHCLPSAWQNNEKCNAIKDKLTKCPDLIPPPHPFSIIPK